MVFKMLVIALIAAFYATQSDANVVTRFPTPACFSAFTIQQRSPGEFNEFSIDVRSNEASIGGKAAANAPWTVMSYVRFSIRGDLLVLEAIRDMPEYYGNHYFSSVIQAIVRENMQIGKIAFNIDQANYIQYRMDLATMGKVEDAIRANPVVKELDRAGFSTIRFSAELQNPMQPFIRLVVER